MNLLRDAGILLRSLFRCQHLNVSFPSRGRQHCLDCGCFRFYEIGAKPSKWFSYQYEGHVTPSKTALQMKGKS